MDQTDQQSVIAFDTLYTNNHIQILKILLPFFDVTSRRRMAILIKFMELQYTIEHFQKYPQELLAAEIGGADSGSQKKPDIIAIFEQIKNFCTPSERSMFEQLANMKKTMDMYEEMQGMMQMFSQMQSAEDCSGAASEDVSEMQNANPMDMLKGMLSPEQQAMFDLFQSSFGAENS
ncbi:MAG: hypothetical protein IJ390_14940 [Lachnospiraceae bacterium]|nr:hypothetical protein [Lachnospiraceae bacterium]